MRQTSGQEFSSSGAGENGRDSSRSGGKAAEAPLKHGHNILWSALFEGVGRLGCPCKLLITRPTSDKGHYVTSFAENRRKPNSINGLS